MSLEMTVFEVTLIGQGEFEQASLARNGILS